MTEPKAFPRRRSRAWLCALAPCLALAGIGLNAALIVACASSYPAKREQEQEPEMTSRTPQFADLVQKYGGRIQAGNTGAQYPQHAQWMAMFLAEWRPIGKTVAELEAVVGAPTEIRPDEVLYRFEDGYNGFRWRFIHRGGVIHAVEETYLR